MAKTMTASGSSVKPMTDGQIESALEQLRAAMRKHRSGISSDVAQQVLGVDNLGMLMFAPFRERAEAISNLITRRVPVNRGRQPEEALAATGRKQYTDSEVVKAMPRGEGDEVEVVFFKLGHNVSDVDLDREYELRGLKPADPFSLAAVNEADPAFADQKPNCTHWQGAGGKWCCASFRRWVDERRLGVYRGDYGWGGGWWFAGLRR